jgi:hypothetical protein
MRFLSGFLPHQRLKQQAAKDGGLFGGPSGGVRKIRIRKPAQPDTTG